MKKLMLFVVALSAIAADSQALEPVDQSIPIENIAQSLKTYAESIGCGFTFDKKNVVRFDIDGDGREDFVALFWADAQCFGGKENGSSHFAVLNANYLGRIYVRPEMSSPAAPQAGVPRHVDRIFLKGNQLWYSGTDFDFSKGGKCCPVVPVEAQISLKYTSIRVDDKRSFSVWYWIDSRKF